MRLRTTSRVPPAFLGCIYSEVPLSSSSHTETEGFHGVWMLVISPHFRCLEASGRGAPDLRKRFGWAKKCVVELSGYTSIKTANGPFLLRGSQDLFFLEMEQGYACRYEKGF